MSLEITEDDKEKIKNWLVLNPQVRKNILEAVEKKTLNKNKTLEQER